MSYFLTSKLCFPNRALKQLTHIYIHVVPRIPVAQDSLWPYPWPRSTHSLGSKPRHSAENDDVSENDTTSLPSSGTAGSAYSTTTSSTDGYSRTKCLDNSADDGDKFLEYKLPPSGATAGAVLLHTKRIIKTLFQKQEPLIFKFGYTHSPHFRWKNSKYGYKFDRFNRWTSMIVLFESCESCGPAMLEAALIELFGSTLSETIFFGFQGSPATRKI